MRRALARRLLTLRVRLLFTRPPVILWLGDSPSQEQNLRSEGNALRSGPHSERTVMAVRELMPAICVRSTPKMRLSSADISKYGSFLRREMRLSSGGKVSGGGTFGAASCGAF